MKQSRVKRLAVFFFSFFRPTLFSFLAKSCVLAGPAAEREWAFNSSSQYGRRSQTARSDLTRQDSFRPAAYTPIRARQSLTAHQTSYSRKLLFSVTWCQ
jgi:hypothetical protein